VNYKLDFVNRGVNASRFRIGAVGEILWDLLPQGKQLGGAPVNFACTASRLGNEVTLFSSVGDDYLGAEARHRLKSIALPEEQLQVSRNYPTGTAEVELNANGDASFNLRAPVAWDDLLWTGEWRSVVPCLDAIYFGSLCQRNEESRRTIQQMLDHTSAECVRIFDVNLRSPFYSASVLQSSIEKATILKLNENELPIVMQLVGCSEAASIEKHIAALFNSFRMELIAVTFGSHGSLIASRENIHRHGGIRVPVADTVGTGDAFTASLTSYYLRGAPIQILNEAGNVWGSWVASQTGAMPDCTTEIRDRLARRIEESVGMPSAV